MLNVGILIFPNVQQLDVTGPYETFASVPGSNVHLLWKNLAPLTASTRLTLQPTMTFAECPPLDVLCVPGGGGINPLLQDAETLNFVRGQAKNSRYVTSVCTGALLLGAAGLLRGKRATTHWLAHDFLSSFGAIPVHERIVRDGNLITAGGVTAGIDFGLTVIAELLGQTEAEAVQLSIEYTPAPPFQSGCPQNASAQVLEIVKQRMSASRKQREQIIAAIHKDAN